MTPMPRGIWEIRPNIIEMLKMMAMSNGLTIKPNAATTNQRRTNSQIRERSVMKNTIST